MPPAPSTDLMKTFKADLMRPQFVARVQEVLPSHINADRFMSSVAMAVYNNPYLLQLDRTSLFQAAVEGASLGLDCSGGVLGHGALVPFKGKVKFVPMYRGLIDLVRRGSQFKQIHADTIHTCDERKIQSGTHPRIDHIPNLEEPRTAENMLIAYAVACAPDGSRQFAMVTKNDVNRIRDKSSGWVSYVSGKTKDSPWEVEEKGGAYLEMAKKTALRRLCKLLPASSDLLVKAMEADDTIHDAGSPESAVDKVRSMFSKKQAGGADDETVEVTASRVDEPASTRQVAVPFDGAEAFKAGFDMGDNPFNGDEDEASYVTWGETFLAAAEAAKK